MYKFEIKTKYKDLVRQGLKEDARVELDKLRFFSRKGHFPEQAQKTVPKKKEEKPSKKIWTKSELQELDFDELRDIGYDLGVKGRSKSGLIKDILEEQK